MKRISIKKMAVLLFCTALLTGCGSKSEVSLQDDFPMDPEFSSGVGGWGTSLTLERGGTFSGQFHDSDMGAIGEDYPNGTVYLCHFSGRFSVSEKVDEYSAVRHGGRRDVRFVFARYTHGRAGRGFSELVAGVLCAGRSAGNTGNIWAVECQNGIWVLL